MDSLAALQMGLAPALATALLHALWQVAILAAGAWLALAAMARSSASLRHVMGMGFLLAMVLTPAWTFVRFWQQPATDVNAGLLAAVTMPRVDGTTKIFEQESSPVALVLALLWLGGVLLMLLRHVGGWRLVSTLDRLPFEPLPAIWQRRVDDLRAAMRIGRDVSVRLSREVVVPFAARLLRPVIWLPLSLLTRLPHEQAQALIAHELAHVARMDWLWNGLQCLVESLLFFHPAAWWLGRRIRQEREHACDDLAVAACGDAIALAEALAQLERHRHPTPQLVLAAHGGSLMQRITRLVSGPASRGPLGARAGIAVVLAAGTLLTAQVGIAGNGQPGLHLRSTTEGVLRPGDMREVVARTLDGERYYRASVDAQGQLTEIYKRDGESRPIDAGVRSWLAEVSRLTVPPAPPLPPAPPAPPAPPTAADIPLPPPPPAPPEISDSVEFRSLLRLVAADPAVVARLGAPIAMASNAVHGRIEIGGGTSPDGIAHVSFDLTGPNGRATARVDAQLDDGVWSIEKIDLKGPAD